MSNWNSRRTCTNIVNWTSSMCVVLNKPDNQMWSQVQKNKMFLLYNFFLLKLFSCSLNQICVKSHLYLISNQSNRNFFAHNFDLQNLQNGLWIEPDIDNSKCLLNSQAKWLSISDNWLLLLARPMKEAAICVCIYRIISSEIDKPNLIPSSHYYLLDYKEC